MTPLTDLARLLRHLDPMPPRVLADALAAGALLKRALADVPDSPVAAAASGDANPADAAATGPATADAAVPNAPMSATGTGASAATSTAPAAGAAARLPSAAALPGPRAAARDELTVLAESVPAVRAAGRRLRIGRPGAEPLLELEIRQLGPVQRVAGLAPAGAPLTIRHERGDHEVHADETGYFTVEVPAGPIRIRLREAESGWL